MRKRTPARTRTRRPTRFKKLVKQVADRRVLDVTLVLAAIFVVGYLGYLGWVLTSEYSSTRPVTDDLVRLQIVDGVGNRALVDRIEHELAAIDPSDLEIEIVSSERIDSRDLPRTLLISRLEENDPAYKLAAHLGLADEDVLYRPLADNPSLISATLVIGEDFPSTDLP